MLLRNDDTIIYRQLNDAAVARLVKVKPDIENSIQPYKER